MTFDPNKTIAARVKRRIVPNWKSRLFDFSTIALAALTGIGGIWVAIPEDIKATFAPWVAVWVGRIMLALAAWGTIGKFLTQGGKQ